MHDAATVDLLLRLTAQLAESRGGLGSIHVFSGTCLFVDRNILKYAGPMIDFAAQQSKESGADDKTISRQQRRLQERQQQKTKLADKTERMAEVMKGVISVLDMPSGFVLSTSADVTVCGPIKEIGLDQPISSLIFRAGPRGLKNTFAVGLVEELGDLQTTIESPLLTAQREMGNAFFPLRFPTNAVRMIPLAIYRKVPL